MANHAAGVRKQAATDKKEAHSEYEKSDTLESEAVAEERIADNDENEISECEATEGCSLPGGIELQLEEASGNADTDSQDAREEYEAGEAHEKEAGEAEGHATEEETEANGLLADAVVGRQNQHADETAASNDKKSAATKEQEAVPLKQRAVALEGEAATERHTAEGIEKG
jgi:hypothetical protein